MAESAGFFLQATPGSEADKPCMLVVGPEGDFTAEELKAMVEAGARPVGLGANRLRVETAAIAAVTAGMLHWESTKRRKSQETSTDQDQCVAA